MKKSTISNVILILLLVIGLSLLLYPSFSDFWNARVQSRAIASYSEEVATLDEDQYLDLWTDAVEYNKSLLQRTNSYTLTEEQQAEYDDQLNISGSGVMGYIEIPSINVYLPIYHSTEENVLQVAIGHLEWTSLPTGGESTHCVVSGHRGLPSARLFTDLDQLREGDLFMLRVLDELMTYEVDQILIVEPHETEELLIQEGSDLCTLVTCTPYAVNTHRLLVRGHRVENVEETEAVRVTADAIQVEPMIVAVLLFGPILIVLLIAMMVTDKSKNRNKN